MMICTNKTDLLEILIGVIFMDYMIKFVESYQDELDIYMQKDNVNDVILPYVGNLKFGKKPNYLIAGHRHPHICRVAKVFEVKKLRDLFLEIPFTGITTQDLVRWLIWNDAVEPTNNMSSIVINDLSLRVCLNLGIPIERTYIQSDSYEAAKLLRKCFKKVNWYFPIKEDNSLGKREFFLAKNNLEQLIGHIPQYHFENFLCIYFDSIKYLHSCIMNNIPISKLILSSKFPSKKIIRNAL